MNLRISRAIWRGSSSLTCSASRISPAMACSIFASSSPASGSSPSPSFALPMVAKVETIFCSSLRPHFGQSGRLSVFGRLEKKLNTVLQSAQKNS